MKKRLQKGLQPPIFSSSRHDPNTKKDCNNLNDSIVSTWTKRERFRFLSEKGRRLQKFFYEVLKIRVVAQWGKIWNFPQKGFFKKNPNNQFKMFWKFHEVLTKFFYFYINFPLFKKYYLMLIVAHWARLGILKQKKIQSWRLISNFSSHCVALKAIFHASKGFSPVNFGHRLPHFFSPEPFQALFDHFTQSLHNPLGQNGEWTCRWAINWWEISN